MRDHPDHTSDTMTARREGCASDGSFSRTEYALMLHTPAKLVTLAGCRFDDPARAIARAGDVFAGRTLRTFR